MPLHTYRPISTACLRDRSRSRRRRVDEIPVRRRLGYSHDHGEVTRFVVQLEYLHEDEWTPVVRYDHDPASEHGHDVTDKGLHIDVYRDGETYRQEYVAPPMPAGVAIDFAEDHLTENIQQFTRRFEEWHEIRNR